MKDAADHEDLADVPIEGLMIVRPDRWTLWIEGPIPILPPRTPYAPPLPDDLGEEGTTP